MRKQLKATPVSGSSETETVMENTSKRAGSLELKAVPRITELGPGGLQLEPNDEESFLLLKAQIRKATGTTDDDTAMMLLLQAALASSNGDSQDIARYCNAALALLRGIGPRDSIAGMLAVQMIGTHNLGMKFLERSLSEGLTTEQVSENINRATKLLRLFTAQVEALNKYRNKGRQKVTVEHVHVFAGGQAIVGTVEHERGGRGKGK